MNENRLKRGIKELGLDELLSDIQTSAVPQAQTSTSDSPFLMIPITQLHPNPNQPRKSFDDEKLAELANSIRTQGVIQPIVVRVIDTENYEIIAGERRYRASKQVGLTELPCIVRDISNEAAVAVALIENIQRDDLNPIEEAQTLHRLIEEFQITHQKVADMVGKSRASVTNALRLLNLESQVKSWLEEGDLSVGHAKLLLALSTENQIDAAKMIIAKELSVRETEQLIYAVEKKTTNKSSSETHPIDPNILNLQNRLSQTFHAPVTIVHNPHKNRGKLVIQYHSLEELEGILGHIKGLSEA